MSDERRTIEMKQTHVKSPGWCQRFEFTSVLVFAEVL